MKKGFTLIELVAVITVLGIILAMVVIDTQHFNKEQLEKDKAHIEALIEENAKTLVYTDNEIEIKVNDKLQALEETDPTNAKCYISYGELLDAKLMDKDTKYPTSSGTKEITDKSYIIVSLDNNDYKFEFVYRDTEVPHPVVNCLEN